MVGVCCLTVRTEWLMKDSELAKRMCVMVEATILMLEWLSMREKGIDESDGDEEYGMIEKEK